MVLWVVGALELIVEDSVCCFGSRGRKAASGTLANEMRKSSLLWRRSLPEAVCLSAVGWVILTLLVRLREREVTNSAP